MYTRTCIQTDINVSGVENKTNKWASEINYINTKVNQFREKLRYKKKLSTNSIRGVQRHTLVKKINTIEKDNNEQHFSEQTLFYPVQTYIRRTYINFNQKEKSLTKYKKIQ